VVLFFFFAVLLSFYFLWVYGGGGGGQIWAIFSGGRGACWRIRGAQVRWGPEIGCVGWQFQFFTKNSKAVRRVVFTASHKLAGYGSVGYPNVLRFPYPVIPSSAIFSLHLPPFASRYLPSDLVTSRSPVATYCRKQEQRRGKLTCCCLQV
jgi:hypothetical protein